MIGGWAIVCGLLAALGAPLVAVAVILILCERAWDKRVGEMGSDGLFRIGFLLCLPLFIYLVAMAWHGLCRQ
jgi:hypothetical protein